MMPLLVFVREFPYSLHYKWQQKWCRVWHCSINTTLSSAYKKKCFHCFIILARYSVSHVPHRGIETQSLLVNCHLRFLKMHFKKQSKASGTKGVLRHLAIPVHANILHGHAPMAYYITVTVSTGLHLIICAPPPSLILLPRPWQIAFKWIVDQYICQRFPPTALNWIRKRKFSK